jgi:hypothetical protein
MNDRLVDLAQYSALTVVKWIMQNKIVTVITDLIDVERRMKSVVQQIEAKHATTLPSIAAVRGGDGRA